MKKLNEWKLAEMPIGTKVELIYEEDVCFLEKLDGTLTNNDFCGFVEITDSRKREFILEYSIVREIRICQRLDSILRQTPPGAQVFFSAGPRENRVPDMSGTVLENDTDSRMTILTDQGARTYLYDEIRSFLVREVPKNAAAAARSGLSWRTPRNYLKLSSKAIHDTFLLLPGEDKRRLHLSYERFLTAQRKGNMKALKNAAVQMRQLILWEEEKGYYWSSEAVCFCGALLQWAGAADHEIYLVGECFGAAALTCWQEGLYGLGGAYAVLSVQEENPCCLEELAIILAAGVIHCRDISGLDILVRRMPPEMEIHLEQILDEAFQVCGLSRPRGQSIRDSIETLRPLFPARTMAAELEFWGEPKTGCLIPGLQLSRVPKTGAAARAVPAAG